ncbi:T9SS type A sorting domain-containing protein [Acetivibrio cellulolyticus]|uniref:T9SS type A sorting domain-containing protein n=1 Tax=Acetivibrio cellulolyticus TaxID=35830 RepID=UPI0001E2C20C|nr:T9SS type A sorting domain-containing protein [Acetivibrio cellulolyticus]
MKKNILSLILIVTTILSGSMVFAEPVFDYEPNDSPYSAYVLNGDSTLSSTIANSEDVDFYNFYVNGTVDTVITLTSPKDTDYDLKLFDENYNEIGSSSLSLNNDDIISINSLTTGIYSIKVYSFNKSASNLPYTLSTRTVDINGTNTPSHAGISEANKNNTTMANVLEIDSNTSFIGKMDKLSKARYFKFNIKNFSDINISMTPPKGVDLDIKLYSLSGLEVGSSTNKDGTENISKSNLLPGIYYLKVYGCGSAFSLNTYRVTVEAAKAAYITTSKGNSANNYSRSSSQTSTTAPRALLLYVGPYLSKFTDDDLKKLLVDDPINTKDFIITDNGIQYNTYYDKDGKLVDIVTPEKINAMTLDKLDSTGKLDQIKLDYLAFYQKAMRENSLDYFASEAADLASRLIKIDSSVKLTIAIPEIKMQALSYEYIEPVKEKIIKGIKERLDFVNPDYWEENIRGFYFSSEGIPYYYTWFKPDKTINFDNPVVKTMLSFSNEIHQVYNKEFMWIPYYGNSLAIDSYYNKEQFVRIGYIANRTNIFDYIFIQPSYYFKPKSENIPFVKTSTELNAVVDMKLDIVGGIKTSKTLIGPEMEIDTKLDTTIGKDDSLAYQKRYNQYVTAFSNVKSNTPVAFYAGSRDEIFNDTVYNSVKNFFKSIQ